MSEKKRIVFVGGGTAGHVIPALTVIEYLKEKEPDLEILFIGNRDPKIKRLVEERGISFRGISAGKVRRYFTLGAVMLNILDFLKIGLGIIQSRFILNRFRPDLVFLKGGYVCVPVALAGKRLKLRLVLHESDVVMGWANRISSKYAEKIFVSFPVNCYPFPKDYFIQTGKPVANEFSDKLSADDYAVFGLKKDKPIILITGGSQGAGKINELIRPILDDLLLKYQVIHQTGKRDYLSFKEWQKENGGDNYLVFDFINEMAKAMKIADLVISRASSTILELAYLGKPAILIPLSTSASDHQAKNAALFEKEKAAIVLDERKTDSVILLESVEKILRDEDLKKELAQNIKQFNVPNATERIAEEIMQMIRKEKK